MRNLSLTAAAVLLLAATAWGQRDEKKLMGLKGPVKSVRSESAEMVLTDGKWVAGPGKIDSVVTFDTEGRKTEVVYFNADNTPRERIVYTYVSASTWTQKHYRADGELKYTIDFTEQMDPDGTSSRRVADGMEGKLRGETVKKYDAEGRVVETLGYDRDNTLRSRGVNRFGEGGLLQEYLLYNGEKLLQRHVRTAEGMEVSIYNADDTLQSKEVRKNPVELDVDAHGNWTRQVSSRTVHESGRVKEVRQTTLRSITYF